MNAFDNEMALKQKKHDALNYDTVIDGFKFDHANKKWSVWECHPNNGRLVIGSSVPEIYDFSDIKSFEIVQRATPSTLEKNNVIPRAIVGGIIAGGVGAVVGAISAPTVTGQQTVSPRVGVGDFLQIEIEHRGFEDTLTIKPFYSEDEGQFFLHFDSVNALIRELEHILSPSENVVPSIADELRKFKSLLDDGIITQDEFNAKKKQLLNI